MKKSLKIGDTSNPSFPLDQWDINHTSLQDLFEIEPKAVISKADIAFLEQFFSLSNENDTILEVTMKPSDLKNFIVNITRKYDIFMNTSKRGL
jgi:hypothetical protein